MDRGVEVDYLFLTLSHMPPDRYVGSERVENRISI